METTILPLNEIQLVQELITKKLNLCTVFVFGYRNNTTAASTILQSQIEVSSANHHFDIVIISENAYPNCANDIANIVAERSAKFISVSLLIHKAAVLASNQLNQQLFFDKVFRKGQRLCIDPSAPPYIKSNGILYRDINIDRDYWHKCNAVADYYLQSVSVSTNPAIALCNIANLHIAIEEIALGLIRVFMGYTPNEFSLKYLLLLCGHFTKLPSEIFSNQSELEIKRYKMLCAPPSMLRYWYRLNAEEEDYLWILNACKNFYKQANTIVIQELERLENTKTIIL